MHKEENWTRKLWSSFFVGYANNVKGYRLFDEEKRRILIRRDVIFNESDFDLKQEVDISCSENKVIIKKDEKISVDVTFDETFKSAESENHQRGRDMMSLLT